MKTACLSSQFRHDPLRPIPIVWVTFGVWSKFLRSWQPRASFAFRSNFGSLSWVSIKLPTYPSLSVNWEQLFQSFKLFFLTDVGNYCEERKIKLLIDVYIIYLRSTGLIPCAEPKSLQSLSITNPLELTRLGTKQLRADVSHLRPGPRKRPLVTRVTFVQPEERQIVTKTWTKNYQPLQKNKKTKNQLISKKKTKINLILQNKLPKTVLRWCKIQLTDIKMLWKDIVLEY